MRKIVVAFDHAGVDLHDIVVKTVRECGCDVIDVGTDSHTGVDFPDYAFAAAQKILDKDAEKGIFVCGSGIGMCLAANKIKGIYAAVCHDWYSAHQAVEHDDINVMCLGSRVIGPELAHDLITAFLSANFNFKPNQTRRMDKVRQIENGTFELKNNCLRLLECGQSIWLDNIRRGLIKNGKLAKDIDRGMIRGITSNPSIIRKAITETRDYDNALTTMALANADAEDIFYQLMVEDIRNAADLFRDLYIQSQGNDGFVCLEVSPLYAHDAEKTAAQARQLWKSVNRPNLMIKIPVTDESLPAITDLVASGINLNLTLIFSPERYEQAAFAYIEGLRQRLEKGESIDKIRSVASVFISRIDVILDAKISEKGVSARNLLGQAAIHNAQKIYNKSLYIFGSESFLDLKSHGANTQRILWASTSTKNPLYRATYYIDALIGKNTVSSVTPDTLESMLKSCSTKPSLPVSEEEIEDYFTALQNTGIVITDIFTRLETEGVETFCKDYQITIDSIRSRCERIRTGMNGLQNAISDAFKTIETDSVMRRIFSKDPTVWTFDTQAFSEIRNRLGWLDTYKNTETVIPDFISFRNEIKKEGITNILFIGSSGTCRACDSISKVFEIESDFRLQTIDTANPIQIADVRKNIDPQKTLFIVSCKTGMSAVVRSLCRYFYEQTKMVLDDRAGSHFAAITDPGTHLEKTAKDLQFRKIFFSEPSVDEKFIPLTSFGILPAVLMGLDGREISLKVQEMMQYCSPSLPVHRNEGVALGSFIGTAAALGKDKLTIIADSELRSFVFWLENLIAGATGKDGKGIIPIVFEPKLEDKSYSDDRMFVYINRNNTYSELISEIRQQGHPIYEITVNDRYDLFAEFYRWEIAISVACYVLQINPFSHFYPNDNSVRKLNDPADIRELSSCEGLNQIWSDDQTALWSTENLDIGEHAGYNEIITQFILNAKKNESYIAINAFLPQNDDLVNWLQQLRSTILQCTNCATTLNFGPNCLNSSGQIQKVGKNNVLVIQFIAEHTDDIKIQDEDLSFSCLERALAFDDLEKLVSNGRKVLLIQLKNGFHGNKSQTGVYR